MQSRSHGLNGSRWRRDVPLRTGAFAGAACRTACAPANSRLVRQHRFIPIMEALNGSLHTGQRQSDYSRTICCLPPAGAGRHLRHGGDIWCAAETAVLEASGRRIASWSWSFLHGCGQRRSTIRPSTSPPGRRAAGGSDEHGRRRRGLKIGQSAASATAVSSAAASVKRGGCKCRQRRIGVVEPTSCTLPTNARWRAIRRTSHRRAPAARRPRPDTLLC